MYIQKLQPRLEVADELRNRRITALSDKEVGPETGGMEDRFLNERMRVALIVRSAFGATRRRSAGFERVGNLLMDERSALCIGRR